MITQPPLTAASPVDLLSDGLACHRAGDHVAAERRYRAALELAPHLPHGLHLLGVLLTETGRASAGREVLRQAAMLRPGHADTRLALARACAECGDLPEAIALLRAVLADRPRDVGLMLGLAHLHTRAGDHDTALAVCHMAVETAPQNGHAHAALACNLAQAGCHAAALTVAGTAVALDPRQTEAWLARGVSLRALGRPAEAVAALEHAHALAPGHPAVLLALGNARADCGHAGMAEGLLRQAAAQAASQGTGGDLPATYASLAAVLTAEGFLPEAIAAADAAIAVDPGYAPAWWNRAIARLLNGDLAGGFADAEWRKRHPRFAADFAGLTAPEWDGGPLAGRHLLVHAGQGMGDTIQFARYLPALAAAGARVTLACAADLVPLLAQIEGVAVVRRTDGLPPHDCWVDQMSLPHLLGTSAIPSAGGYLAAGQRGAIGPGLHIGLVWAGNPAHGNDRNRSLPRGEAAELLRPLRRAAAAMPRLRLVGLQVGPRAGELADLPTLSGGLADFADTADLVAALDLVITVDTAVAHLAGALGRQVWLMLPHAPDWRWQLGRPDSPWYASMRLFRQPEPGDWNGVIRAVAAALRVRYAARDIQDAASIPPVAAAAVSTLPHAMSASDTDTDQPRSVARFVRS